MTAQGGRHRSQGRDQHDHGQGADQRISPRGRLRRTAAALAGLALAAMLGTTACVGPPSSGTVRTKPLSQSHNNVFIIASEPSAEMSEQMLVLNFLQALTGDQKDPSFSVAQDYLTAESRKSWIRKGETWNPDTKVIMESLPAITVDPQGGADHGTRPATSQQTAQTAPVGTVTKVSVKGTQLAELDAYGFYRTTPQRDIGLDFTLIRQTDGWRIQNPPPFRMITMESFKRVYQTYQSALPVYLPTAGVQKMDQVYLTQATGKIEYTYNGLADAVLHGRGAGQDSAIQLAQPVTVSSGVVKVQLKVPPGTAPILPDVERALRSTFAAAGTAQQLIGTSPQVTAMEVAYDGCGSGCAVEALAGIPKDSPAVYWVCPLPGGNDSALVSKVPGATIGGTPVTACPTGGTKPRSEVDLTGLRLVPDAPIAVKQSGGPTEVRAPSSALTAAVVVQDPKGGGKEGSVTVVGKSGQRQQWYTTVDTSTITDLEWDPADGSLWMVDKHFLYRLRDPGDKDPTSATRDPVMVPASAPLTRFKPSPDGSRAVVVVGPGADGQNAGSQSTGGRGNTGGNQGGGDPNSGQGTSAPPTDTPTPWPAAAMVTILRATEVPKISADTHPLLSDTLSSATDVAWADGRTVVLLGISSRDSNTLRLYKVYSDGSQDSTISDAEDAQSAAKHIAAGTGLSNGRSALWIASDGAGPNDPSSRYVYFKGRGGTDSYQEPGWSPVVATVVPE
ncbi:MAG: hypothetical protein HOV83_07880 [Catenulispora sp.]|nr:hypothetical protein [Catenulispora sp.]